MSTFYTLSLVALLIFHCVTCTSYSLFHQICRHHHYIQHLSRLNSYISATANDADITSVSVQRKARRQQRSRQLNRQGSIQSLKDSNDFADKRTAEFDFSIANSNEDALPFPIQSIDANQDFYIAESIRDDYNHVKFYSFDDLFPNLGFSELFDTNANFREDIRLAARKVSVDKLKQCCTGTDTI